MNTSLGDLAREYENSLVIQSKVIAEYREKLSMAIRNRNSGEIKRLNTMLRILYDEKNELEERTNELRAYCAETNILN